ncbi:MAG TPA: biotin--[acetyl-CoA-carboxylase] ligase [Myxococcota bacterium]|jgi:BirA family biotin operon repressor/biotin-[acetyl-CoA-carboxylase] ligase
MTRGPSQGRPRTAAAQSAAARAAGEEPALTQGAIGAKTAWLGQRIEWFAEIDSTNRRALAIAAQGAERGTAVIAEAQSAGRGRLGRTFFSPPRANLYVSFVLRPSGSAQTLGTLPLAAGVALAECVAAELGDPARVELKWPNDVLVDDKKVSGILLERASASGDAPVILGIGVNLNVDPATFPDDFRARASSLSALAGRRIDRARFAAALFERLEGALDAHAAGGLEALRSRFDALFRMTGRRVRVADAAERTREGVVLGVGADGSLRLGTYAGEERFLAGDVTVLKESVP